MESRGWSNRTLKILHLHSYHPFHSITPLLFATCYSQFLPHSTMKLIANIHHKPGNDQAGMKQMCKTFAMHLDQGLPFIPFSNKKQQQQKQRSVGLFACFTECTKHQKNLSVYKEHYAQREDEAFPEVQSKPGWGSDVSKEGPHVAASPSALACGSNRMLVLESCCEN